MVDVSIRDSGFQRAVRFVTLANLAYFGIEFAVALAIGSVSLFADSIDFLEDASMNLLMLVALDWTARSRARVGMGLAGILLVPGLATLWMAWQKESDAEISANACDCARSPYQGTKSERRMMQHFWYFQNAGCINDRGCNQERKPRRRLVVQTRKKTTQNGRTGARDTRDKRRALPKPNGQCAPPRQNPKLAVVRALTQALSPEKHDAVDNQKQRRNLRRAEQMAQEFFEHEADNHGRDRGNDHQPDRPPIFRPLLFFARADESADKAAPVAPKVNEKCCRGAEMEHDQEG